ncbi:MAG: phosphate ABC transporter permease subunit PstC [Hyphomicrobiales bacterium]|nr:phosphate ABC transporter permease subunit PstC [Hyphomicrobiales bacterium]
MTTLQFLISALVIVSLGFQITKQQVNKRRHVSGERLAALPHYYGWCAVIWAVLPAGMIYLAGIFTDAKDNYTLPLLVAVLAIFLVWLLISPRFHARKHVEQWLMLVLKLAAAMSILITLLIVGSVLLESVHFFQEVPLHDFLFGTKWSPQSAGYATPETLGTHFGAVPVFTGTLLVTTIAVGVAGPLGLFSAIYLSEYAQRHTRAILKPVLELLAGIPTVVYGFFAAVLFGPTLREVCSWMGMDVATESAFVAGTVMGIMIIPFVLSLTDDVMHAVPTALRDGSYALGATRAETVWRVIVPAALPGIMGAFLLAISRAIGETMIVVMAAGLAANMTLSPLEPVTTVTVQIVTLLVGDQEFDSAKTLSAFALGLTLFVLTLLLNIAALVIVKRFRERYD